MLNGSDFRPIILAGGSGTRFWPRSRRSLAKQVLALDGERTMIQSTVDRLAPIARTQDIWVVTNDLLSDTICGQLAPLPKEHVICEPVARNTAPAAGLAAFLIERTDPDAVLGMFPADHVIADEPEFLRVIEQGIRIAAAGANIIVLGIKPTRPETGYGYIETGSAADASSAVGALRVRRFTEKPNLQRAEGFLAAGNYHWNSGIFLWSARTLANALREHLPETAPHLEKIAAAHGTPAFEETFRELYPLCENISIDYAVLEPRSAKGEQHSQLFCIPANFGWNDLGSWAALYEHQLSHAIAPPAGDNVIEAAGHHAMESHGNYAYSPDKFVALVGVRDLVVVDTGDVLLVTTRERCQDVGKMAKELAAVGRPDLL